MSIRKKRFSNLPDDELIRQFGEAAEAKRDHLALRREILARGLDGGSGGSYQLIVSTKAHTSFDYEACRELLGDETFQALWKTTRTTWVQAARVVEDEQD